MICEHAITEFCECLGPRKIREYEPRVEFKPPGHRLPEWECQCRRADGRRRLRNHRHKEPWECLPANDVLEWAERHGCNLKVARPMMWMALNFDRS